MIYIVLIIRPPQRSTLAYTLFPYTMLFRSIEAGVVAVRQRLYRQRDAAGAEPAAGRAVGAAAVDSPAAALWRHPAVLQPRRLQPERLGLLHHRALGDRAHRLDRKRFV